jgi:hypothetical protein
MCIVFVVFASVPVCESYHNWDYHGFHAYGVPMVAVLPWLQ